MTLTARALSATDCDLLRQMTAAEAVVPIRSPEDLARRLAPDRRIFVVLADEVPQGFVHVALTAGLPRTLDEILSGPVREAAPRYAIFYGITRVGEATRGQAGRLLKAVSAVLLARDPDLTLVTQSPLPGFRRWLEERLDARGEPVAERIEAIARQVGAGLPDGRAEVLAELVLAYLAAQDARGRVRDPVARFHLGNGAAVDRVLVGGDCSWRGLRDAFGMMVSYRYHPRGAGAPVGPRDVDALLARLGPARHAA